MDQAQRDSRQKYFQEILLNIRDGKQMSIWFTDKFIEDLKTTHNLSVTTELLRSDIQEMAFIYLDEGPYGVRDPYVDLTKAASLNELVAQVGALRSTLSAYGREHWPGVLSELENSYIAMPKSFGTEFPSTAGLDSDRAAFIFTQRFLRALKKHFVKQIPHQKPKRRGHPRELGTDYFVWYGLQAWEAYTSKSFTIDAHNGQPTSPALCFIADVLDRIDPDAPKTAVVTAARKARRDSILNKIYAFNASDL